MCVCEMGARRVAVDACTPVGRFVPAKVFTVLDLQHLVLTSNQIGKLPVRLLECGRLWPPSTG